MTRSATFSIPSAKMESATSALRRRPTTSTPTPRSLPSIPSWRPLGTPSRPIQSFTGVNPMLSSLQGHGRGVSASAQRSKARDPSPSSPSSSSPSTSSSSSLLPTLTPNNFPDHVPVLLAEVLEAFSPLQEITLYIDGTLGAGGHASALVRHLGKEKNLKIVVGLDVDERARALAARALAEAAAEAFLSPSDSESPPVIRIIDANFRDIEEALEGVSEELKVFLPPPAVSSPSPPSSKPSSKSKSSKPLKASAILLDLGVSSMQLDSPERGFSFAADGPLDMRLDGGGDSKDSSSTRNGGGNGASFVTAATIVNTWPESDLASLFAAKEYGGERHAKLAARRIVKAREESDGGLKTTRQLALAIGRLGPPPRGGSGNGKGSNGIHPATRVFQALRLAVNDELGALEAALPKMIDLLEPGGRLAVISFHSGEDRVVKRAFLAAAGRPVPPEDDEGETESGGSSKQSSSSFVSSRSALLLSPEPPPPPPPAVARLVTRKPVVAGDAECRSNPRARSAKLRVIEKL